jgi:2-iminoacetate synthase ThiH
MTVTLDLYELKVIIREAAQLGAKEALVQAGLTSRYLTQTSAYKQYGRKMVENWIKEGKIIAHKNGDKNSKVQLDRLELECLVKGEDLIVYFKQAA